MHEPKSLSAHPSRELTEQSPAGGSRSGESAPAKHTPGPWAIEFSAGGPYIGSDAMDGLLVAVAHPADPHPTDDGDWHPGAVTAANARLIAAAPELLEACRALVAWDEAENSAKPYVEDNGKAFYERLALCADAMQKARTAFAKATGTTDADSNGRAKRTHAPNGADSQEGVA